MPSAEHVRNVDRHKVITAPELLSLRVDESLHFVDARLLGDRIYAEVAARPELCNAVLMCSAGVGFHLSEVKGPAPGDPLRVRMGDAAPVIMAARPEMI